MGLFGKNASIGGRRSVNVNRLEKFSKKLSRLDEDYQRASFFQITQKSSWEADNASVKDQIKWVIKLQGLVVVCVIPVLLFCYFKQFFACGSDYV